MARAKVVAAAKVKLFVNGKVFGQVMSFRFSSDTARNEVYGVDNLQPIELLPSITRTSGSMSVHRMTSDVGAEGVGLVAPFPVLPKEKYFSLTLVEIDTDLVIFEAPSCALVTQSWGYDAGRPSAGEFSFKALGWSHQFTKNA